MIIRIRNSMIKLIYVLIDLFFIIAAIYLVCFLRQETLVFDFSFRNLFFLSENSFSFLFLIWIITTIFSAAANRLYETRRDVSEFIEIWLTWKSVIISSLILILAVYVLKIDDFPRSIWLIGTFLIGLFLSLWRIGKRLLVEYLVVCGYRNLNVLIVGAGRVGQALAQEIKKRPGLGLRVVGFLDDRKTNTQNSESKILGKLSDFSKIAQREFIYQVYITIHHDMEIFHKIIEQARERGVAVRVVPHGYELISGELFRYNIGYIPLLEYSDSSNLRRQTGKRIFDLVLSISLFLFLLPLYLLIALLIKLDSRGPVLYKSRRYSRNGKIFNMYKFRSMVKDADQSIADLRDKNEVDGPIFKIKSDPRVTRFGRFLRKYSLDEFPQIFNVLKGDMSLVGPRPLPIEQIEREDLRQYKRLEVRPGITGLWQIRGRSDISFSRLVRWDIWYINNWSLWLDLYIMIQTFPVVLRGKGAY